MAITKGGEHKTLTKLPDKTQNVNSINRLTFTQ